MPNRSLIIAIEHYRAAAQLNSLAIEGTHEAARKFYQWLLTATPTTAENVFVCSDGLVLNGHPAKRDSPRGEVQLEWGATRSDILGCVSDLLQLGADTTGDLFVFYGGHGFAYTGEVRREGMSYLFTSEYAAGRPPLAGAATINLDLLQETLCLYLAGKRHFHFVDACRNLIPAKQIAPETGLPIAVDEPQNLRADCLVLYSARFGNVAQADQLFSEMMLDSLRGVGYGKEFRGDHWWVTFPGVLRQLEKSLGRRIDRRTSGYRSDDIYALTGPQEQECTVRIEKAEAEQQYTVQVWLGNYLIKSEAYVAPGVTFRLDPNSPPYGVRVLGSSGVLERTSPALTIPIDMYSPCELVFTPSVLGKTLGPLGGNVSGVDPGKAPEAFHAGTLNLTYDEAIAKKLRLALFSVKKPPEWSGSRDRLLMLWLACAGAALIRLGPVELGDRIRKALGMQCPPNCETGGFLLIAVAEHVLPVAGLHAGSEVELVEMQKSSVIPGVFYQWFARSPESGFISLSLPGTDPVTYATGWATETECTLVTAQVADGWKVQQFFVPVATIPDWGAPEQPGLKPAEPMHHYFRTLRMAALLSLAQTNFLKRTPVWQADFAPSQVWQALREGAWSDPLLLALALYDALRQDRPKDAEELGSANIETEPARKKLWGRLTGERPLLLEPLLRSGNQAAASGYPLPASRMNYRDIWVCWTSAIQAGNDAEEQSAETS